MESHPDAFCIKSIKERPKWHKTHPSCTDNFDFGEALSRVYPLLGLIFDFLPIEDLRSCMDVSESWRTQAEQTLAKRKGVGWFTCYKVPTKKRKSNVIAHSKNIHYNNAEVAIIFYNNYRITLNEYVCVHHNISELTRLSVPEYFEYQLVPPKIDYCFLSVQKAASHFDSGRTPDDVEFYGSIFDGVIIPKIPSMRTVMFVCNPGKKSELEESIKPYLRPNEVPKCLLLFSKTQLHECLYNILECIIPKDSFNSVALGGGIIKGTKTFQKVSRMKRVTTAKTTLCILFLKDTTVREDSFCAYSTVIKGAGLSKEEFDTELYKLKNSILLKRHSVGFRICCSSKYQTSELTSFSEIFPTVPIVGLEAYGEFGWNSYPDCSNNQADKKFYKRRRIKMHQDYPNAENEFSTVFVLLTWD